MLMMMMMMMMMKPVRETVSIRNAGFFGTWGVNWRDYWPIDALHFFRPGRLGYDSSFGETLLASCNLFDA